MVESQTGQREQPQRRLRRGTICSWTRTTPERRIAELERQLAEQKRIAELERQLADAKAAAHGDQVVTQPAPFSDVQAGAGRGSVDEHARRYAQALWEGLRTGGPPVDGGSCPTYVSVVCGWVMAWVSSLVPAVVR